MVSTVKNGVDRLRKGNERRGPSNINLGIFVCSFDVCRAAVKKNRIFAVFTGF